MPRKLPTPKKPLRPAPEMPTAASLAPESPLQPVASSGLRAACGAITVDTYEEAGPSGPFPMVRFTCACGHFCMRAAAAYHGLAAEHDEVLAWMTARHAETP